MLPARQHLEAVQPAGCEIDLLLEIGHDLAARDRQAQPAFQFVARLQFALHRLIEPGEAVAARFLGSVHRDVGAAQQCLDPAAIEIGPGDPDRGADVKLQPIGSERLGEARHQALGNAIDRFGMLGFELEAEREFVAAEPRDDRDRWHGGGDFLRDVAQQRIADGVAVHVVDGLEMIEVEHQQRHRLALAFGAGEHGGAFFGKGATVEKSGQRIARGKLLRTFLGS